MTTFAVFLLSLFAGIWHKPVSGVGCRSPPANLDFSKNSDWRKQKCHSIMAEKKRNGGSGKKPRKSSYGAWVSVRIPLKNSIPTIGRSLTLTDGITADCRTQVHILLEQIRTIDKQRLKQYMGMMPDSIMARVDKALAISLSLADK